MYGGQHKAKWLGPPKTLLPNTNFSGKNLRGINMKIPSAENPELSDVLSFKLAVGLNTEQNLPSTDGTIVCVVRVCVCVCVSTRQLSPCTLFTLHVSNVLTELYADFLSQVCLINHAYSFITPLSYCACETESISCTVCLACCSFILYACHLGLKCCDAPLLCLLIILPSPPARNYLFNYKII